MMTRAVVVTVVFAAMSMTGIAEAQQAAGSAAAPPAGAVPQPPPEVAAAAKTAVGTWSCKGQGLDHTMKMADTTGTLKVKLDLDGWWLHDSFESKMGKEGFHYESYATFDATTKKWKRVLIESGGGWSSGDSDGIKDGKLDWNLAMHSPRGDIQFRDHMDVSDPKTGMKLAGEFSMDGKAWTTVYSLTCKK
jgi:hypothetical protein